MDLFCDKSKRKVKIRKLTVEPFKDKEALLFTYLKLLPIIDFTNEENRAITF